MLKYVCMLLFVLIIFTYASQNDLSNLRRFLRGRPVGRAFGCSSTDKDGNWNGKGPRPKHLYQPKNYPKYQYKQLFRDYVYREMSPNTKELFVAVGVHPSCVAKKGQCIHRNKCIGDKMLYISRVCYKRDLVCCYQDYPPLDYKHALIRPKEEVKVTTTEKIEEKKEDKGKEEKKEEAKDEGKKEDDEKKEEEKEDEKKDDDKKEDDDKNDDEKKDDENNEEEKPEEPAERSGKAMRREDGYNTKTGQPSTIEMNSTIAAILLPSDNKTSPTSWWLVHDVTKQEILEKIDPSIKVNEVDFNKVLAEFPEMTAYLDNSPPQNETADVLDKEETDKMAVELTTKLNPI